jgi:uncharacterized protein (TIGR03083 family)
MDVSMDVSDLIAAFEAQGALMSAAARTAGPGAAVPTCPDWSVRDLLQHTGGVHRWADRHLSERCEQRLKADLPEVVGEWPADDALFDWFDSGVAQLAASLRAADPAFPYAAFLPAPTPLAFWARRQLNETAIHRVDAESALGEITPMSVELAAAGVDEMLRGFVVRPRTPLRAEPPVRLGVSCTDNDGAWTLHVSDQPVATETGLDQSADCVVRGSASDLFYTVWNRPSAQPLHVEGDSAVFGLFAKSVQIRWR